MQIAIFTNQLEDKLNIYYRSRKIPFLYAKFIKFLRIIKLKILWL